MSNEFNTYLLLEQEIKEVEKRLGEDLQNLNKLLLGIMLRLDKMESMMQKSLDNQ